MYIRYANSLLNNFTLSSDNKYYMRTYNMLEWFCITFIRESSENMVIPLHFWKPKSRNYLFLLKSKRIKKSDWHQFTPKYVENNQPTQFTMEIDHLILVVVTRISLQPTYVSAEHIFYVSRETTNSFENRHIWGSFIIFIFKFYVIGWMNDYSFSCF